jgi:hypothetical protein
MPLQAGASKKKLWLCSKQIGIFLVFTVVSNFGQCKHPIAWGHTLSFWANLFLSKRLMIKCLIGKCRSGQLSLCKCLWQTCFWANIPWANVLLANVVLGNSLFANVSGQIFSGQMSYHPFEQCKTRVYKYGTIFWLPDNMQTFFLQTSTYFDSLISLLSLLLLLLLFVLSSTCAVSFWEMSWTERRATDRFDSF